MSECVIRLHTYDDFLPFLCNKEFTDIHFEVEVLVGEGGWCVGEGGPPIGAV